MGISFCTGMGICLYRYHTWILSGVFLLAHFTVEVGGTKGIHIEVQSPIGFGTAAL